MAKHDVDITVALPSGTELPAYWQACLDELHDRYGGICAYLAVFFERTTGREALIIFTPSLCALILRMNGAITVWPVQQ